MCFGSKENKIFRQQQQESYGRFDAPYDASLDFGKSLLGYFEQQYGGQSETLAQMKDLVGRASSKGPGSLGKDWLYGGYGNDPTTNPPGPYQNKWGTGGEAGGAGGSANMRQAAANARRQSGDEAGAQAIERGEVDPFADMKIMSGFNERDYQFAPRRFHAREESAMRGEASEGVTKAFGDAQQAFGQRALQLGQNAPGLMNAGIANLEAERAANEAAAQRAVLMQGAENLRGDMRAAIPLNIAKGEARAREASMQNDLAMKQAQMRQQAAMQRAAIAASRANARQAAGAMRQASQAQNSRQRALDSEYARRFDAEMRLKGAQFQSENFWKGIGALGSISGMQSPLDYGQMGLGAFGQAGNIYQNPYSVSSEGMTATRSGGLGGLLGAALGGALSAPSFGAGGFANKLLGNWIK